MYIYIHTYVYIDIHLYIHTYVCMCLSKPFQFAEIFPLLVGLFWHFTVLYSYFKPGWIHHHRERQHAAREWHVTHTGTYWNTLQHTATHCNTLQHTAKHLFCFFIKARGVVLRGKSSKLEDLSIPVNCVFMGV